MTAADTWPPPRIPLPAGDELDPAQRAVFDTMISGPRGRVVGPIRAAIHNPELAERWQHLGALLRYGTSLSPRVKELAILVTARHWDSRLEWILHTTHAANAGVPSGLAEAVRQNRIPDFDDPSDRAVYEFVAGLLRAHDVSDEVYGGVLRSFGVPGVVELTALVGYYSMVAMTLNVHRIPLPDGGTTEDPFPPPHTNLDTEM
ncbi:carboxymuconolactone decarboxylase family protein [Streptomyces sp. NBC_00459]|uniref:carboxymuconolactone decarboxylase family protein n=1 Tax=Streptomyces sp. NBC_00459 TaxID=2975749 RepID=UPI002E189475